MPVGNPKVGSAYIWLVSCVLFISIAAGGGLLLMYMTQPESQTSSWLPIVGVALVCLPWFFWFITFFYRIISRCCGFRLGGGGDGGGGGIGGANVANATGEAPSEAANGDSSNGAGRHVHFGTAVVVDEHGNKDRKDENQSSSSSSSNSINDISFTSHESEMPLALSMAS